MIVLLLLQSMAIVAGRMAFALPIAAVRAVRSSTRTGVPLERAPAFERSEQGRELFLLATIPLLRRLGLTQRQALLLASAIAIETGFGSATQNNNAGNVRAFGRTRGDVYEMRGLWWRAFPTWLEGLRAMVAVVQHSHPEAWSRLLANDPEWYRSLGASGYYGAQDLDAALRSYLSVYALARRIWFGERRRAA